jgi:hypothetical protein
MKREILGDSDEEDESGEEGDTEEGSDEESDVDDGISKFNILHRRSKWENESQITHDNVLFVPIFEQTLTVQSTFTIKPVPTRSTYSVPSTSRSCLRSISKKLLTNCSRLISETVKRYAFLSLSSQDAMLMGKLSTAITVRDGCEMLFSRTNFLEILRFNGRTILQAQPSLANCF